MKSPQKAPGTRSLTPWPAPGETLAEERRSKATRLLDEKAAAALSNEFLTRQRVEVLERLVGQWELRRTLKGRLLFLLLGR